MQLLRNANNTGWISVIGTCCYSMNDNFLNSLFLFPEQVYNSVARSFPRRFVLPLHVGLNAPEGKNLSPLTYSSASAVKQADGKVCYEWTLDYDFDPQ